MTEGRLLKSSWCSNGVEGSLIEASIAILKEKTGIASMKVYPLNAT